MNDIGLKQINNLEDLDFRKLIIGEQFMSYKLYAYNGIPYNQVKLMVLGKIYFDDIYIFKQSITNIFQGKDDTDDYDEDYYKNNYIIINNYSENMHIVKDISNNITKNSEEYNISSVANDDIYYIINDKKIRVDYIYKYNLINIKFDYENILEKFIKMIELNKIRSSQVFKKDNMSIENYLVIPIKDNFLCCHIYNKFDPQTYDWNCQESYFLLNKNNKKYIKIVFNKDKNNNIIDILNSIPEINNSKVFKKFYKFYSINKLNIEDYIKNPNIINDICKTFKCDFLTEEDIKKYYTPIFEDDKCIIYLKSKYKFDFNLIIKNEMTKEEEKIALRKANAILEYNRYPNNRIINIYTGEINDKHKYKEIYKDAGGLIISETTSEKYPYNYIIIDNIYIRANYDETNNIKDRMEMVKKLEQAK